LSDHFKIFISTRNKFVISIPGQTVQILSVSFNPNYIASVRFLFIRKSSLCMSLDYYRNEALIYWHKLAKTGYLVFVNL